MRRIVIILGHFLSWGSTVLQEVCRYSRSVFLVGVLITSGAFARDMGDLCQETASVFAKSDFQARHPQDVAVEVTQSEPTPGNGYPSYGFRLLVIGQSQGRHHQAQYLIATTSARGGCGVTNSQLLHESSY